VEKNGLKEGGIYKLMAKTQISLGSKGDEVKELQTALNSNGYSLDVDGIFGSKTQAAVRDYQTKNNLQVDGIVGKNTWASLSGGGGTSTSTTPNATGTSTTTPPAVPEATKPAGNPAPTFDPFTYDSYKESETVSQAKAALDAQLAQKPGAYQSEWTQMLKDTLDKINNREDFTYDLNGDALYQQYKNQYVTQGQLAMQDTMGQAAALTGGYGNSYAQNAGQQAYHGYLQQLNDRVPELYRLALDKYNAEGDDLYRQYALYGEQENMDYGRYRDTMADYTAERDRLQGLYDAERQLDYSKYLSDRDFALQGYQNDVANKQWQAQFDEALRQYNEGFKYQQERDRIADEQWQAQFDLALGKATGGSSGGSSGSSSTGSSGGSGGSGSGSNKTGYSTELVKKAQAFLGVTADGDWGSKSQEAMKAAGFSSIGQVIAAANGNKASGSTATSSAKTSTTSDENSGYFDAVKYLKSEGVDSATAAGVMTESEWRKRKNAGSSSAYGSTYFDYVEQYLQSVKK
jgi:peptidoglycan hydrolase-like protein with peptidoglycan-binding domain